MCLTHQITQADSRLLLQIMLYIIRNTEEFRSHPRRFAVRSLAILTYNNKYLVKPSVKLLLYVCFLILNSFLFFLLILKMTTKRNETSQFVRKAVFCSLSRIGRMYPDIQPEIEPAFESIINVSSHSMFIFYPLVISEPFHEAI